MAYVTWEVVKFILAILSIVIISAFKIPDNAELASNLYSGIEILGLVAGMIMFSITHNHYKAKALKKEEKKNLPV